MKKSILTAALLLASSSVMALDSKVFVGLDATSANVDVEYGFTGTATISGTSYSNLSAETDDTDTSLGIKAGAIIDNNHRIYGYYTKTEPDVEGIDSELKILTLNYDYLADTGNAKLSPYIGAHIGQSDYEIIGYSDKSMMYGVQAGILYDIADNIEFEAGLSYSWMDSKPESPTVSGTSGTVTLTNASIYAELQNMTRFYVGMNFKF